MVTVKWPLSLTGPYVQILEMIFLAVAAPLVVRNNVAGQSMSMLSMKNLVLNEVKAKVKVRLVGGGPKC